MKGNFIFLALLLAIVCAGCEDKDLCSPAFNPTTFDENIKAALEGQVMGYAYVLTENGQVVKTGTLGKAQSSADGNIDMSLDLDMQVASISKFITSTCAIHVCRLKGVPLTTAIGSYLPSGWARGAGIDNVTIAELISQTSGLTVPGTQSFGATQFDSLQVVVQNGATLPKTRSYTNTNAALLRIVLPRLWDKYRPVTGAYDEAFCASTYKLMVQELLFDKISITGDCMPSNGNQILAYSGANDATGGSGASTDFSLVSGGTGWNLTCRELAKFWAYAWFSNDFINDEDKTWAKDNRADLWNSILGGKYGNYYCKLGGWNFTNAPTKSMNSVVMLFPNNYQLTLFTNSPVPGGISLATLSMNAYDNAFNCK
ncbi:MAG: serine hydrolase [Bacteroidia bacterium]